ncbi:MAG: hypothetical protein NTZ26_01780 [Candidatus Aminicenantes bacterium]|nr:hypothetical protein [Candidatus Aminicenantes bacterium]
MKRIERSLVIRILMAAVLLAAGAMLPLFAQAAGTPGAAQEAVSIAQPAQAGQAKADFMVVKSYELKYIGATEFMRSARFYVMDSTGTEKSLTVRIMSSQIPAFEALLKKLDVEKKNIQFRVYAIAASQDEPPQIVKNMALVETKEIADRDLKKVLDEMKGLWNFKHYWIGSPSFLIAKDGSGSNGTTLVSPWGIDLVIREVVLRGDEPGKRTISLGEITVTQSQNGPRQELLKTSDITLKERGYLVVGVSGLGFPLREMALILVINAEVK